MTQGPPSFRGLSPIWLLLGIAAWSVAACRPDAPGLRPPAAPPCCAERPRPALDEPIARGRADLAPRVFQPPMPIIERSHPRLGFPEHGSIAVGSANDGVLIGDATLPLVGPHHAVLAVPAGRRTNHGADEMVALLTETAAVVARDVPGALLLVGNIARPGGGRIPWSVSHRNGLDADIAFYLIDAQGAQVVPELFVTIDTALNCVERPDCRLDVPRTWRAVEALVANPTVAVQWLFVARHIQRALLAYAEAQGRPADLVRRAATVMHEPRGSSPHDDHIHIRIHCPADDILDGCQNIGVAREDMPDPGPAFRTRVEQTLALLRDPDPVRRAGAVALLTLLDPPRVVALGLAGERNRLFIRLLDDPAEEVRAASLHAVGKLALAAAVPTLVRRLAAEESPFRRYEIVETLAGIGGASAARALVAALDDARPAERSAPLPLPSTTVAARAAFLLGSSERKDVVEPLIRALGRAVLSTDAAPAAAPGEIRRTLRMLTNQDVAEGEADETAAKRWRSFWERNRRHPRQRWVEAGFDAAGHREGRGRHAGIRRLLAAIGDDRPFLSYNARRNLSRLSGLEPGSEGWSRYDAHWYWSRWCSRRYGAKFCTP